MDVFFVISGFLITSHLLRKPPPPLPDLTTFWARRVRRLLPASLLVLAVTLDRLPLVAPETQWANTARQAGAAALYVVNWLLAGDSVDYLAAENAPTPGAALLVAVGGGAVLLRLAAADRAAGLVGPPARPAAVGGHRSRRRRRCIAGLRRCWQTATAPAAAYFVTPTRAWEFALGGVAACLLTGADADDARTRRSWRLTTRGRTAVAASRSAGHRRHRRRLRRHDPVPGLECRRPGAGCGGRAGRRAERAADGPLGPDDGVRGGAVAGGRVVLGLSVALAVDRAAPVRSAAGSGLLHQAVIVVVTLVLAALTKHFVEDRFRSARVPNRRVFGAAALGMAAVLVLSAIAAGRGRRPRAAVHRRAATGAGRSGPVPGCWHVDRSAAVR